MSAEEYGINRLAGFMSKIFRVKTPEELVEASEKNGLKRTLNAFDLIVLGVAAVVGTGIFTLSGVAIAGDAQAGPSFMVSLLIAGTASVLAALSYAEFASMIPVSGSAYTYVYSTLGEICAWLMGWILMLEYAIGNITVAVGWTDYWFKLLEGLTVSEQMIEKAPLLRYLQLPEWMVTKSYWIFKIELFDTIPLLINIPAIIILTIVTSLLYKGVQESTKSAALMVVVKLSVIAAFILVGAFYVRPENWTPFMPGGFDGIFQGAFLIFFAYIGFDAVATVSEETKDPQKNVPIGIIGSLGICTLIYMAIAAVLTGMLPLGAIDTAAPLAVAMKSVDQNMVAGLISLGAVAGLASVLLVLQLGTTRILFAMSRDKFLPSVFSRVHKKFNTPYVLTIAAGVFVAAGTFVLDLESAAHLCNIGTFTAFMIVSLGVLILRKTDPDRERPFKVPFCPYVPITAIAVCLCIIWMGIPRQTFLYFGIWIILGLIIYFAYGYKNTDPVKPNKGLAIPEDPQVENI